MSEQKGPGKKKGWGLQAAVFLITCVVTAVVTGVVTYQTTLRSNEAQRKIDAEQHRDQHFEYTTTFRPDLLNQIANSDHSLDGLVDGHNTLNHVSYGEWSLNNTTGEDVGPPNYFTVIIEFESGKKIENLYAQMVYDGVKSDYRQDTSNDHGNVSHRLIYLNVTKPAGAHIISQKFYYDGAVPPKITITSSDGRTCRDVSGVPTPAIHTTTWVGYTALLALCEILILGGIVIYLVFARRRDRKELEGTRQALNNAIKNVKHLANTRS